MHCSFPRATRQILSVSALCVTALLTSPSGAAADAAPALQIRAAAHETAAMQVPLLGAARAGSRIVAVGDHGVVLLSDDNGKTFRQAQSVPVSATLTSVAFADHNTGWAVGHWGSILKTSDGGEHWVLQRTDVKTDQPLFSVYFRDAREGWAVGLWSLLLHTRDGGHTWTVIKLPHDEKSKIDRNFYAIFGDRAGGLYVACEQGRIERSSDGGNTWTMIDTGYGGSFWTGVALSDGTLLVGGLRGTIYRSTDHGANWHPVKTNYTSSITGLVENPDRSVSAIALDGVTLTSSDDGASFTGKQRLDRLGLTAAVIAADGRHTVFSEEGPRRDAQ
jgi:photosystem II stability/assembly factor-like uncharacterized protein